MSLLGCTIFDFLFDSWFFIDLLPKYPPAWFNLFISSRSQRWDPPSFFIIQISYGRKFFFFMLLLIKTKPKDFWWIIICFTTKNVHIILVDHEWAINESWRRVSLGLDEVKGFRLNRDVWYANGWHFQYPRRTNGLDPYTHSPIILRNCDNHPHHVFVWNHCELDRWNTKRHINTLFTSSSLPPTSIHV